MTETSIRLSIFITLLIILAIAQWRFPRRIPQYSTIQRWLTNFSLVVLDTLIVRLTLGFMLPVSVALWADQQGWGLFNIWEISSMVAIGLSIVALDALIYWQHRVFHRVPLLWRLHRIHHYDKDYDLSTALRFHPIEILLSVVIKNVAILLLGAPVVAVLIFESLLNGMALFNHANIALPLKLDQKLRYLLVTPDMHRVHHSTTANEMHRNFGFNLSLWDRLFNSYTAQPKQGHLHMQIGQPDATSLPTNNLYWLLGKALKQPLSKPVDSSSTPLE